MPNNNNNNNNDNNQVSSNHVLLLLVIWLSKPLLVLEPKINFECSYLFTYLEFNSNVENSNIYLTHNKYNVFKCNSTIIIKHWSN